MTTSSTVLIVILVIVVAYLAGAIRILREYQRAVVFTLGRFTGVKGPGLIMVFPFVQVMARVELRTIVLDVPTQDLISRDNVSIHVNAVIYFRVVDAERAIIQVEQYVYAISQLAQTTLRSVLGKHDLDEMLAERDKLNKDIQEILDAQTSAWGIKSLTSKSNMSISRMGWSVRSPGRPRPNASAAPGSSTLKASSKRRRNFWKPPRSYPPAPRRCSYVISGP